MNITVLEYVAWPHEVRSISPYAVFPHPDSRIGRAAGPLRTAGPLTHFVGAFDLRDGFGIWDDDPTFNPIDAPECMPSGCVATIGSLSGSFDRED